MSKKDGKKSGFDFEAIKNSPATQVAEQEIMTGFDQMNGAGTARPSVAQQSSVIVEKPMEVAEPTQDINIPIPMSQHTRLLMIKARTRQNIKSMVVQAIGMWLDAQEGKLSVKSEV